MRRRITVSSEYGTADDSRPIATSRPRMRPSSAPTSSVRSAHGTSTTRLTMLATAIPWKPGSRSATRRVKTM
ncbi:hypothetical protein BFL35_13420 [Clavibacter michiganensis]|nr:hypothetical protein BFL35_13420 [Clavibacter michiganensis]